MQMSKIIGVYGASGFGIEVMPLIRIQYAHLNKQDFVFIDDDCKADKLNGYRILSYREFIKLPNKNKEVSIAIANSKAREILVKKMLQDNILMASITAKDLIRLDSVEIGIGTIICNFFCLTSNIKIGNFFHGNIYSYIAHNCIIGDYVTFAPRVNCNGNIHIHDHAYIGTGAIIKQGTASKPLVIGEGAIVGMGAVVTKDVPPGVVVVGNPARLLIK